MKKGWGVDELAHAALCFIETLHCSGGYDKEMIKRAFCDEMIDAYFKLIDTKNEVS